MKEREIFVTALHKSDPAERAAYLAQACGDAVALRDQVELLLREHERLGSFLEPPTSGGTVDSPPASDLPGTVLANRYKLLEEIGEGGMGAVLMAQQTTPVKRLVAVKLIKPGMDSKKVLARFEAERQALALMDHPNIARVLDGGATSLGRPYFVMDLVKGAPITDFCDQNHLTPRERLELFISVCQAVQHAHQKGIIHRDLKPSNVLVTVHDTTPVVKIIDFGVAKALGQELTEKTLFTGFAEMIGTPLYMSPEQAGQSGLDIDTRSDIYSLGVLLYELLTGTTPFDKDRFKKAPYDEIRRIIREEDPPRPSTRISTLQGQAATTLSAQRKSDPRRLCQLVRGDLDWIVMKCLEKDRSRRYETANGLAMDVQRYLADEPVQACPPSASYRFRKFARRNKTLLAASGAIAAALFMGLGLSTWMYFRATTENVRAKAVSDLLQEMLGSADAGRAKGAQYTVRELLDDFSAHLGNQLADQPEVEADIHFTIGRAYRSLAVHDQAQPHFEEAIKLRRHYDGPLSEKLAAILVDYGWNLHDQHRYPEAESHLREALEIYRQRGVGGGAVVHALSVLQHVLISSSRVDDAEGVTEEALDLVSHSGEEYADMANLLHRYADLRIKQGRFADGEELARQAVDLHRRLHGEQHPETAWGWKSLASALRPQQKLEEAEEALRESLKIFRRCYPEDHVYVVRVILSLKTVLEARKDQSALETLAKDEAERASRSDSPDYHLRLARLLLTNNPSGGAHKEEARQLIRRAFEEYGQVAVDYPDDLNRRLKVADGYVEVARHCAADKDFAQEIDESHRRLKAELEGLLARFPDSTHCQEQVGHKLRLWAFAVQQNNDYLSQVEQAYRQAIKLFENLSRDKPSLPRIWFFLANTYALLGDTLWRSARPQDAESALRRAIDVYSQHPADELDLPSVIADHARSACYLAKSGREQEAKAAVNKAMIFAQRLPASNASADPLYYLAVAQARLEDKSGYRATCKALFDIPVGNLVDVTKSRPVWTPCLAADALEDLNLLVKRAEEFAANKSLDEPHFGLYVWGATLYRAGEYEQAAQRLEESITVYPVAPLLGRHTLNYPRLLLAMAKWQQGKHDEGRRLLAETEPAIDEELRPSTSWNRRATLELLRREAEALIGKDQFEKAKQEESLTDKPSKP